MISFLRELVDLAIKLFALGLFITIILNWFSSPSAHHVQRLLNQFYDIFLNPIRRYVKPVRVSQEAPVGLDLAPLILLLAIWILVHPFIMWVLS